MVGEFFIINNDYKVEVISYKNNKEVTIKFENGFTKVVEKGVLLKGKIKNPYHPTLYNIGYIGIGKYKEAKEQHIKEVADKWRDLIGDKIYKILITYKIT